MAAGRSWSQVSAYARWVVGRPQSYAAQPIPTTTFAEIEGARAIAPITALPGSLVYREAAPSSRSRPTSETPRTRRFALPHLDDPRTDEAIDALLAGAERRRGRPAPEPLPIGGRASFEGMESRIAWMEALHREDARQQRYRHSASIVVFEARALTDTESAADWLGRIAGPIAHTIRRTARATDRVTRASETRFMALLPETSEADAAHYAERVLGDCAIWLNAMHAPVAVRASAAAASAASEHSLEDALSRAIDALAMGLPAEMADANEIDWAASRRSPD